MVHFIQSVWIYLINVQSDIYQLGGLPLENTQATLLFCTFCLLHEGRDDGYGSAGQATEERTSLKIQVED